MPVKCLVCGKPTSVTHMGMNTCRACMVFYRRNQGKRLVCVMGYQGCMNDPKHTFACRKCRLERFEAILKAGTEKEKIISPTQPKMPIIERIRANYNALSIFRRNAELELRGIDVNFTETYNERLDIIPSTYQYMNEGKKIQIAGLFMYIPLIFPEFRVLRNSDKWLLIRNYYRSFHCLDSALRVLRMYGKNSFEFFFGSYTTVISIESIGHFFDDCPDQTNAATATKTMFGTFHNVLTAMRNQIRQVDPSEDEFMALIGLAFWSFENIDPSEELLALAERYRALIIAELTSNYRYTMSKQRSTSRAGVLLCSLQEFRRAERLLQTDYEIFHILGTFDNETVTYKLGIR